MKKKRNRFFLWLWRLVLIFLGLLVLAIILFYVRREAIKQRALDYYNSRQAGELFVENINLIPFLNFPRVSVKVDGIHYFEDPLPGDSSLEDPFLSLDHMYVSLDIIDLIRGEVNITEASMKGGTLFLVQYADSTTNLQNALGDLLDANRDKEKDTASININLDRIQLSNVDLILEDHIHLNNLDLHIHNVRCNFSYQHNIIETGLAFRIDLRELSFLDVSLKAQDDIRFDSDVLFYPESKKILIDPSMLSLQNTMLEVWGEYRLPDHLKGQKQHIDMTFRALNTGLDLLNFVFKGVLNMDDLAQTGKGFIYLSGSIQGEIGNEVPLIKVDCQADGLGFMIKSLQEEVTDLAFTAYATNGSKQNLSEAMVVVEDFSVRLPGGNLKADLTLENAVTPQLALSLDGSLDLAVIDRIIKTEAIRDLKGKIDLQGDISGSINRQSGDFLDNAGSLAASVSDLSFFYREDTMERIDGDIFLEGSLLGIRDCEIAMNGNRLILSGQLSNLLPYFYGFNDSLEASISMASEYLYPSRLFKDSAMILLLGNEIKGLQFDASASIAKHDLDAWRTDRKIPRSVLSIERFQTDLSSYANISEIRADMYISPDTLRLSNFSGRVGDSDFAMNATISNYNVLSMHDSSAVVRLDYRLSSERMRAEDFFTVNDEFLMPETYQSEYLEDLLVSGYMQVPAENVLKKQDTLSIDLGVDQLRWNFRYYPLSFRDFTILARYRGNEVFIDDFRGRVGESDLKLVAHIGGLSDSTDKGLSGSLDIQSSLLDFNELLNYQKNNQVNTITSTDTLTNKKEPPKLHEIDYPDFELNVDIGELRFDAYKIYGMKGKMRSSSNKIFYLDSLTTTGQDGGSFRFDGYFYVATPHAYTLSANLDVKGMDIRNLDLTLQSKDEELSLQDNFEGFLDANGMAEIVFTPDLKLNMAATTAIFTVTINDGALINFTPLQAAGKYLGNTDLNYVRFAKLYNRFTLMDSQIIIPLMSVESTAGQLLIEGEHGLDKRYVYLLRLPMWMVRGATGNYLTETEMNQGGKASSGDQEIQTMRSGKFMRLTVWGDENGSQIQLGDKRDRL